MSHIVIVTGSPSYSSRMKGLLDVLEKQLHRAGLQMEWIHVRELPAEDLLYANFDSAAIKQAVATIERADGVLVATPVYKASYTGVLKAFLDLLPQKALDGKSILPVAMGGTMAHLLMIDYALKPVLSVLGAKHILQGVYVVDTQVSWDEREEAEIEPGLLQRLEDAVRQFAQEVREIQAARHVK